MLTGGLVAGVLLVTVGSLARPLIPTPAAAGVAGSAAVLVLLEESGLLRLRWPQNRRQVPQWIIDDGGRAGALQFGFEMGTGARTFATSALPHLLALCLLLLGTWAHALVAGSAFGLGRAWMALARERHRDTPAWDRGLRRHLRTLRLALAVAAAACVISLLPGALSA